MSLTILGSADVSSLLSSLDHEEIKQIQHDLAEALQHYSTGKQNLDSDPVSTTERIAIRRPDGVNTTVAPIAIKGDTGFRVKTTRDPPGETGLYGDGIRRRANAQRSQSVGGPIDQTRSHFRQTSISWSELPRSHSESHPRPMSPLLTANTSEQQTHPLPGCLTILNPTGLPTGLINTKDISPFRAALTSLMLFNQRQLVETVTVFGAGRLAYWHIRLALILRGSEIKQVNIINRTFDRSSQLMRDFYSPDQTEWRSDVKFAAVSPDFVEYDRLLRDSIQKADVIFCCTSSPEPLFAAEILTSGSSSVRRKGRYICATGSQRGSTTELDPAIFRDAVEPQRSQRYRLPHRRHPVRSGVVLVDSIEACLQRAGEIIQAELEPRQLVEVGELMMVRDSSAEQGHPPDQGLREWVEKGNVMYKSAGLDLLDLVLCKDIVRQAIDRGIGTTVAEF